MKHFIEDVDGDYIDMSHSSGPTGISTSSHITRSKSQLTNVIILPASEPTVPDLEDQSISE